MREYGIGNLCGMRQKILWTPANISGALWFDPDNESYRTVVSGQITELYDVIGGTNKIAVTTTDTYRRFGLGVAALNGYDVATAGGLSRFSGSIPSVAVGTNPIAIFAVWLLTSNTTQTLAGVGHHATSRAFYLHRNLSQGYGAYEYAYANRFINGSYNVWQMVLAQRTASGIRAGLAGALSTYYGSQLNVQTGALFVGAEFNGGNGARGSFAGLCVGAFTDDEINKLYGWAAHRFALTSSLPAAHPYKNAPPML
jgi:hypothetical protein